MNCSKCPILRRFATLAVLTLLAAGPFVREGRCQLPAAEIVTPLTRITSDGKYAILVFVREGGLTRGLLGARGAQDMLEAAKTAAARTESKAEVLQVNISDPAQAPLVKKFDVSRAPMPMTLVVAPNGAVMGAFPKKVEAGDILGAMAGPGMQQCMKALQENHLVFLCIQNERTKDNDAALKGVADFKADPRWASATDIVKLDPENPDDAKWLTRFNVVADEKQAVTVFLAPPGTPVGTYRGATDKETLVTKLQSASSACASGCGPSGCGPAAR